jgi:hypothetical protein
MQGSSHDCTDTQLRTFRLRAELLQRLLVRDAGLQALYVTVPPGDDAKAKRGCPTFVHFRAEKGAATRTKSMDALQAT